MGHHHIANCSLTTKLTAQFYPPTQNIHFQHLNGRWDILVQIQTLNTSDFHGGCPKSICSCSLTTAAQFCPNLTCCRNQISQVTLGINEGSKVQIPNWDNCIRQARIILFVNQGLTLSTTSLVFAFLSVLSIQN